MFFNADLVGKFESKFRSSQFFFFQRILNDKIQTFFFLNMKTPIYFILFILFTSIPGNFNPILKMKTRFRFEFKIAVFLQFLDTIYIFQNFHELSLKK